MKRITKKVAFLIYGIGCFYPAFAQQDSLISQVDSYSLLEHPSRWDQYRVFKNESALLLADVMPQKLSVTQLELMKLSGNFKAFKQAERESGGGFRAEGGRKLPKIWMWGQFEYSNINQDSIRWGHLNNENSSSPFYYASQRAVHYKRTNYSIQTVVGIPLFKGIAATLGSDYGMGDNYSTNDPRAIIKHFKLKLTPALQYKHNRVGVEAKLIWGYGQEESQVDYRNKEYYESAQWPEYHNNLSYGYGSLRTALSFSDRVYTNNQDYRGFGFASFYKGNLNWYANFGYESLHEEYDRGNSSGRYDGYDMYGDYDLDQWKGHFEVSNPTQSWRLQAWTLFERGKDFNVEFAGNNYKYFKDEFGAKFQQRLIYSDYKTDLLAYAKTSFIGQRDGNMMIERDRGRHEFYIQGEQTFPGFPIRTTLGIGYSFPYKSHFAQSPRTTVNFIEQVIKHDVVFDNSSYWQPMVAGRYFFDFVSFKWQATASWQGMIGKIGDTDFQHQLGKNRSHVHFRLSLFF